MSVFRAILLSCIALATITANAADLKVGQQYISFPDVFNNATALTRFKYGVALLHCAEYPTARTVFANLRATHPTFTMAYWGEAMTYDFPFNSTMNLAGGAAVLKELDRMLNVSTVASTITAFEQSLLNATRVLFTANSSLAYLTAMKTAYTAWPINNEIAAFYSLALYRYSHKEDRGYQSVNAAQRYESVAVSQTILNRQLNHPGALHYLIRAWDDNVNATKLVDSAVRFSGFTVAIQSSQSSHVAAHVFTRLGQWQSVITAATDAYNAAKQNGLAYDYHSAVLAVYAYLQMGKYALAQETLKRFDPVAPGQVDSRRFTTRVNEALAKAHFAVEVARVTPASNDDEGKQVKSLCSSVSLSPLLSCATCDMDKGDGMMLQAAKANAALLFASGWCDFFGYSSITNFGNYTTGLDSLAVKTAESFPFTSQGIAVMSQILKALSFSQRKPDDTDALFTMLTDAARLELTIDPPGIGTPFPLVSSYEVFAHFGTAYMSKTSQVLRWLNQTVVNYPGRTLALADRAVAFASDLNFERACEDYGTIFSSNFDSETDSRLKNFISNRIEDYAECGSDGSVNDSGAILAIVLGAIGLALILILVAFISVYMKTKNFSEKFAKLTEVGHKISSTVIGKKAASHANKEQIQMRPVHLEEDSTVAHNGEAFQEVDMFTIGDEVEEAEIPDPTHIPEWLKDDLKKTPQK
eukprot:GILJ01003901.1.p1 GENE.GILJ01003901.1~~GILJ01003901.1.p1  ORF type:complete len:698 (-),score=132.91 GILJ01003901.1:250-2343(-)